MSDPLQPIVTTRAHQQHVLKSRSTAGVQEDKEGSSAAPDRPVENPEAEEQQESAPAMPDIPSNPDQAQLLQMLQRAEQIEAEAVPTTEEEMKIAKRKKRKKMLKSVSSASVALLDLSRRSAESGKERVGADKPKKRALLKLQVAKMESVVKKEELVQPPKVIVEGGFLVMVERVCQVGANRFGRGSGATWGVIINSHIPLNKALLRVGFHFGLSTGDRMFGGRQGNKIAWERPKWRFSYKMPFFDPRMPEFQVEKVAINNEDDWVTALGDKPWDAEAMRTKTLEYISVKIESDSAELQEEGTHGMWEFAVHRDHHITFSHYMVRLLLKGLGSLSIRAAVNAACAIWHLSRSEEQVNTLVELSAVERLLATLLHLPHLQALARGPEPGGARVGSGVDRLRLQAACAGALSNLLVASPAAQHRFLEPMTTTSNRTASAGHLALLTPKAAWKAICALAYVPAQQYQTFQSVVESSKVLDWRLPWSVAERIAPELAAQCLPLLLTSYPAREAFAAEGGICTLSVLLESRSLHVARAAASSLRLFCLLPELPLLGALDASDRLDVVDRALAWMLKWARCIYPKAPIQAMPDPGKDETEGWRAPELGPTLQSIAEALNLVVWAVVHIQLRGTQQGLDDHLLAGLVEVARVVAAHQQLSCMALPIIAALFSVVQQAQYPARLLQLGLLPPLLDLLHVNVVPVQERVVATLGTIASYECKHSPDPSARWGKPPAVVPGCMFGPHRQALLQCGCFHEIVLALERWPNNPRLEEVAAAALQHLATQAGGRSEREMAGLMGLLKTRRSVAVMHAAAAMWCLVRLEVNRMTAVKAGGLETVVGAAEHMLEVLTSKPSPTVLTALHFLTANMSILLLDQFAKKKKFMGALARNFGKKDNAPADWKATRQRILAQLLAQVKIARWWDRVAVAKVSKNLHKESLSRTYTPGSRSSLHSSQSQRSKQVAAILDLHKSPHRLKAPPPAPSDPATQSTLPHVIPELSQASKWRAQLSPTQLDSLEQQTEQVRNLSLMSLYSVATVVPEAYQALMELGTANALMQLSQDAATTTSTRAAAITVLQGLASRSDVRGLATNLVLMRLPEGVLEEMHTTLLLCHDPVLQERGAKGCAHLSLLTASQVVLQRCGAIEGLIGLLKCSFRRDENRSTCPEQTLILALVALLNLSLNTENQVMMARLGLSVLIRLNKNGPWSREVVLLSSGILNNLSQHPSNRTLLYKKELHEKAQAAETAVVMGDDGPLDGMKYMHLTSRPSTAPLPPSATAGHSPPFGPPFQAHHFFERPISPASYSSQASHLLASDHRPSSEPSCASVVAAPRSASLEKPGSQVFDNWTRSAAMDATASGGPWACASTRGSSIMPHLRCKDPVPNLRHCLKGPLKGIWQDIEVNSHEFVLRDAGRSQAGRWAPSLREAVCAAPTNTLKIEVSDLVGVLNTKQLASVAALSTVEGAQLAGLPPPTPSAGSRGLRQPDAPAPPPTSALFSMHPTRRRLRDSVEEEPMPASPAPEASQRDTDMIRAHLTAAQRFRLVGRFFLRPENRRKMRKIELEEAQAAANFNASDFDKDLVSIKMGKARGRNNIVFKDRADTQRQVERLDMFKHVPGCRSCQGLFQHLLLPDGTQVHCFEHAKKMVDEVKLDWDAAGGPPITLAQALLHQLPHYDFTRQLKPLVADRFVGPPVFQPAPVSATCPERHTLNVDEHDCPDCASCPQHGIMVPITPALELEVSIHTTLEAARVEEIHEWTLHDSIFVKRQKLTDSKDFYDLEKFLWRMLDHDLKAMFNRRRFVRLLSSEGSAAEEQKQLYELIRKSYRFIVAAFYYYACQDGSTDVHILHASEWLKILIDCNIPNDKSGHCKRHDCDRIFIETNYMDDGEREMGKVQKKDAMMRYEFLEGLLRVSLAKYRRDRPMSLARKDSPPRSKKQGPNQSSNKVDDQYEMASCMSKLLRNELLPGLPKEAMLDRNLFRRDRLYTEEVDIVIRRHLQPLQQVYDYYKTYGVVRMIGSSKDQAYSMSITEYMNFMRDAKLIDTAEYPDGFNIRDARAVFTWGRMYTIDEFASVQKISNLAFMDFIEVLARMADQVSYPTNDALMEWGQQNGHFRRVQEKGGDAIPSLREYLDKVNLGSKPLPRRASAGVFSENTRPLEEKFHQLLTVAFEGLCGTHNVTSTNQLIRKLQFLAKNQHLVKGQK